MRIKRDFQPFSITFETAKEAEILEDAMVTLMKEVERRGGSWWAGWKDQKLSPEQMGYRSEIRRLLTIIDPVKWNNRSLFQVPWQ